MIGSVDAHVHLWNRRTDPQPWIDPVSMAAIDRDFGASELDAMLSTVGVERAVVVQSSNSAAETARLLAIDDARIAGVVGWLDLTADVPAQLAGMGERDRMPGIRHLVHIDPDPEWLGRGEVARGLGHLASAGLSFDLVVRWWQLPLAARVATEHPSLTFVLDHLGGPPLDGGDDLPAWEAALRALAERPNVVAKLSGLGGALGRSDGTVDDLAPVVEAAISSFGASRLMYGSDWPLVELTGGARRWHEAVTRVTAGMSPAETDAITGGTACRVYRIEPA